MLYLSTYLLPISLWDCSNDTYGDKLFYLNIFNARKSEFCLSAEMKSNVSYRVSTQYGAKMPYLVSLTELRAKQTLMGRGNAFVRSFN